jgi:hypothetical protein
MRRGFAAGPLESQNRIGFFNKRIRLRSHSNVGTALVAALVVSLKRPWTRIAVRVAGQLSGLQSLVRGHDRAYASPSETENAFHPSAPAYRTKVQYPGQS